MTTVWFPSLSQNSWVIDPSLMLDILFAQVWCTDYSQDPLFLGQVSSVSKILQEQSNNMPDTINELTKMFTTYFKRYFPIVNVAIEQTAANIASDQSSVELSISISVTDDLGGTYLISRSIQDPLSATNAVVQVLNN